MSTIAYTVQHLTGTAPKLNIQTLSKRTIISEAVIRDIYRLREDGATHRVIADWVRLSRSYVCKILKYRSAEAAIKGML